MKPVLESSLRKDISRRHFVAASATAGTIPNSMLANSNDAAIGPVLGHIDESSLFCFIRPPRKGEVRLKLTDLTIGKVAATVSAQAKSENDLCTRFELKGLIPGHDYHGEFFDTSGQQLFSGAEFRTQTPKEAVEKDFSIIGLGSCISSTKFNEIWKQIAAQKIEAFCLLGDSPYIDHSALSRNRDARRKFWGTLPALGALAKSIPFWNTWDDHDFGRNYSDGRVIGKENIRQAFMEYSALANYGEQGEGIYTKFRRGPVEVWMIDGRWFSQTNPSWADPDRPTCLGQTQWEWLKRTIKKSTAPFKLLCTGMVWYPKGNREKDHWETYAVERDALFAFIKREKISGVILMSGDIHVSRHHDYGNERLGYPLHECVVSPMHERIIPSLDVKHPAKVWSLPAPNVFLKVEATSKKLTATWINMMGKEIYSFSVESKALSRI